MSSQAVPMSAERLEQLNAYDEVLFDHYAMVRQRIDSLEPKRDYDAKKNIMGSPVFKQPKKYAPKEAEFEPNVSVEKLEYDISALDECIEGSHWEMENKASSIDNILAKREKYFNDWMDCHRHFDFRRRR
eukprot:Filipodium_phascolosomae@DN1125_c0_g1_i1.p1